MTTLKEVKQTLENAGLYLPSSMLAVGTDSKTVKGETQGYLTGILYLIPDYDLCPASKLAQCDIACLVSAGRGKFNSVIKGRTNKTKIYRQFPELFYWLIERDIERLQKKADKQGLRFCVRLNGTSDIDHTSFIAKHPDVQFYDYTKMSKRAIENTLDNYHITFSYSAASERYIKHGYKAIAAGVNMAVVFRGDMPKTFKGVPVINGDETDLRFLDKPVFKDVPVIVGLSAKGAAKHDNTGFVVDSDIIVKVG